MRQYPHRMAALRQAQVQAHIQQSMAEASEEQAASNFIPSAAAAAAAAGLESSSNPLPQAAPSSFGSGPGSVPASAAATPHTPYFAYNSSSSSSSSAAASGSPFASIPSSAFYLHSDLPYLSSGVSNVQMFSLIRRIEWREDTSGVTERAVKRLDKKQLKPLSWKAQGAGAGGAGPGADSKQPLSAANSKEKDTKVLILAPNPSQARLRPKGLNQRLAAVFHDLYATLAFKVRSFGQCYVCGIRTEVRLPEEDTVEVLLTAMCVRPVVYVSPNEALSLHASVMRSVWEEAALDAEELDASSSDEDNTTSSSTHHLHHSNRSGAGTGRLRPLNRPAVKRATSREQREAAARLAALTSAPTALAVAAPLAQRSAAPTPSLLPPPPMAIAPSSTVSTSAPLSVVPTAVPLASAAAVPATLHVNVRGKTAQATAMNSDARVTVTFEGGVTPAAPASVTSPRQATASAGLVALTEEKKKATQSPMLTAVSRLSPATGASASAGGAVPPLSITSSSTATAPVPTSVSHTPPLHPGAPAHAHSLHLFTPHKLHQHLATHAPPAHLAPLQRRGSLSGSGMGTGTPLLFRVVESSADCLLSDSRELEFKQR